MKTYMVFYGVKSVTVKAETRQAAYEEGQRLLRVPTNRARLAHSLSIEMIKDENGEENQDAFRYN